jgi:hypothetical protein
MNGPVPSMPHLGKDGVPLYPDGYPIMKHLIPEQWRGSTIIRHMVVDERHAHLENLRHIFNGNPYWLHVEPGQYVKLIVDGSVMMSDTPMERRTNRVFVHNAQGDVLIGGLGIGLLPATLTRGAIARAPGSKWPVTSITVLEKNPDVIAMVAPYIKHDLIRIIEGDVFTWKPDRGQRFDSIYMDIWPSISPDNAPEMRKLKQRYRNWLNQKNPWRFIACWQEDYIRRKIRWERRLERAVP